jgi:N-dimethylarginine dimethylaminohydrolase
MSALAERHLSQATRHGLARAGFVVHTVEIDEIEKAGGSLRCCIGELF